MLQPFFATAMRAPVRHLTFRRTVALHVLLLAVSGLGRGEGRARRDALGRRATRPRPRHRRGRGARRLAAHAAPQEPGARVPARLPGAAAARVPRRGAGRRRPVRARLPRRAAGLARDWSLCGVIVPADLWALGLMPFAWGVVAGLGLTVWAYEPASVRRVGEVLGAARRAGLPRRRHPGRREPAAVAGAPAARGRGLVLLGA